MKPSTLDDYKARLLRVLLHIQRHLDEELPLEELARVACFSAFHFHHVFTGMMGESLKEHLRRLRLERAAGQLKLSARPVTDIALDAGYESHESFTRAFKLAFGTAPQTFRRRNRLAALAAPSGVHFHSEELLRDFKTTKFGDQTMNVKITKMEPMRVAFMRHVGPYNEVGATWDKLLPRLGKMGLLGGDAKFIGVSLDDPNITAPEKIRYDACLTVDEGFAPAGDIGVQTIAGGDYAVATHFGSYDGLSESYHKFLGQWLPRSGRELRSSPCFEVYLNSPENTEPEDLITDIYVPLEPKPKIGVRP